MCSQMNDQVNIFPAFGKRALFAAVLLGTLAGCEETIHLRGNVPDPTVISTIKPGTHKKVDITRMLGSPSTIATFEQEIWYYIGGKVKTLSFFEPVLLERKILTVHFDKKGVVTGINEKDASKNVAVSLVDRETPTRGKELTVLQQLIGNVGRFGTPKNIEDP
jgi:outer membrane protein assembly factor BamE (lipoprotein component of BamABCDE complex)